VTSVAETLVAFDHAESPAATFTRGGRLAAIATLILGASFQVAAFATMPDFDDTAERVRWIGDHTTRADISKVFDILAMPFLLGGVLVYVLLSRRRSPKLAYAGGALLGLGMVGLSMGQGLETLEFALATASRFDPAALAKAVDDISTPPAIVIGVMFLGGVLFGLLVTMAALWRSWAVPRGAVVLIFVFIVCDIALSQPLLAHVIALVAALWIASAIYAARPAHT
jgi:hypothetical protein